ncbi:MAG: hypothetical protein KF830_14090 [Planctomycetes bacterium]|nr:hypothetical protein [Planctomycetota bacterium]
MQVPPGMQVVFRGKADYLREIAQQLADAGIRSVSGPLPGGGWGAQAWLAVAGPDTQRALDAHQRHLDRMLEREGLPRRDQVADLDAAETECPACMAKFPTAGVSRCPDCGLNFGG